MKQEATVKFNNCTWTIVETKKLAMKTSNQDYIDYNLHTLKGYEGTIIEVPDYFLEGTTDYDYSYKYLGYEF